MEVFKVVSTNSNKITMRTAFCPATNNALLSVRYHIGRTTTQPPFAGKLCAFSTLANAEHFIATLNKYTKNKTFLKVLKGESANVLVSKPNPLDVWKNLPPIFSKAPFHGASPTCHHTGTVHPSTLPEGTVLCADFTPIAVL